MQRDIVLCLWSGKLSVEVQQALVGTGQCVVQPTLEPWCFSVLLSWDWEETFFNCFCQHFRTLWLNCKECLATAITITTVSLRFVFGRKICLSVLSCSVREIKYSTRLINFLFPKKHFWSSLFCVVNNNLKIMVWKIYHSFYIQVCKLDLLPNI